jgi:hypothetical protein
VSTAAAWTSNRRVRDSLIAAQWAVREAPRLLEATISNVDRQLRDGQDRDVERIVQKGEPWVTGTASTVGLACKSSGPFDTVFIDSINKTCNVLERVHENEAIAVVLAAGNCARDILVAYHHLVCATHPTITITPPTLLRSDEAVHNVHRERGRAARRVAVH